MSNRPSASKLKSQTKTGSNRTRSQSHRRNGSDPKRRDSDARPASQKTEEYRFAKNVEGLGTAAEREYQHYAEIDPWELDDELPDVLLGRPGRQARRPSLRVGNLDAHLALNAYVLDLVKLKVGVDFYLGRVRLDIRGVEAQALAKVRLDHVAAIVDRVMTTLDRNPELLESVGAAVEDIGAGGGDMLGESGEAVEDVGEGAEQALEHIGQRAGEGVGEIGEGAGKAVSGVGRGAGQAVGDVGEGAGEAVEDVGEGAGEAVGNVDQTVQGVGRTVGSAGEGVGEAVGGVGQGVGEAAGDLGQGVAGPRRSREPLPRAPGGTAEGRSRSWRTAPALSASTPGRSRSSRPSSRPRSFARPLRRRRRACAWPPPARPRSWVSDAGSARQRR